MVVFTCQHCGESLKKAAVEKHYYQKKCRFNNPSLTCVDCLKDFFGQEYVAHTSCVTEHERYSAKGTVFKEGTGKKKQQKVLDIIESLLNTNNLRDDQRKLLQRISTCDNVPRKEKSFMNFAACTAKGFSAEVKISVFRLIEDAWKKAGEQKNEKPDKGSHDGLNSSVENENEETKEKINNNGSKKSKKKENVDENRVGNKDDLKENVGVVSKKAMKKQKKYEKYLLELENAKTASSENMVEEAPKDSVEKTHKKPKKSKKLKQNLYENNTEESTNMLEETTDVIVSKKQKKRKLGVDECEVVEKKAKSTLSQGEEEKSVEAEPRSFDWAECIIEVLQTKPEKELSLKRLQKKVIDEYQTLNPADHLTYKQLLAKFNHKVKKTKGVCVVNDKAKLKLNE